MHILNYALFPQTKNAQDNYKSFIQYEKDCKFLQLSFLGNKSNYAASELISDVLDAYTPEVHKVWSDNHGFFADSGISQICAIVANPVAIYELGYYFTRKLKNKTDNQSLLILSAIAYNAPIPPSMSTLLSRYISKNKSKELGRGDLFRPNNDKRNYQSNVNYLNMYGSDIHFMSNIFDGFGIGNDSLFSDSSIPTNKQDLLKFLIFSDDVIELIDSIEKLRFHVESYAEDIYYL